MDSKCTPQHSVSFQSGSEDPDRNAERSNGSKSYKGSKGSNDSICHSNSCSDATSSTGLELYAKSTLPTGFGEFEIIIFRERGTGLEHVAMLKGDVSDKENVVVRIHSECLTSEVFGSLKCDCKAQLDHALALVARLGRGVILYLRQEGRGIGLGNKIRAYDLQSRGYDTYEANRMLGFADDLRSFDVAAQMLQALKIRSVDLITNNPLKLAALAEAQVPVRRRIPSISPVTKNNEDYLRAKMVHSGHLIELPEKSKQEKKTG